MGGMEVSSWNERFRRDDKIHREGRRAIRRSLTATHHVQSSRIIDITA